MTPSLSLRNIIMFIWLVIFVSNASFAVTKVGFVYVSPVGDAGWTFQHDLARRQLEQAFKGEVVTQFVANVHEGADSERVIRELAHSGCRVIFTTSFGYMYPTLKVAAQFPNTIFMHATGYRTAHNVGVYNVRSYEGGYLNGVLAGHITKTNIAGIVAAMPIPEVVMGINAFTRGMLSVNPQARVKVIWTHSWFNPGREREAASALIAQGADILAHYTDSTATVQVAEERGIHAFGYHSNEAKYGPHAQVSGTVDIWGVFYIKTISDVLAGKWSSTNTWGGFSQNMIAMSPFNDSVPKYLQSDVLRLKKLISKGKLHPFFGPVFDQNGYERVPTGRTPSDNDLGRMNYFVKGVESRMPNS